VNKKQRRTQDRFIGQNGIAQQADIHAALTLALYPLLRPKSQQVNGYVHQQANVTVRQVTNISISG
jgi:hypothetical protein